MGISTTQYRIAIGLYNNCKSKTCACIDIISLLITIGETIPVIVLLLLILLCGDIELNPGPDPTNVKQLSICHSNIRGLRDKLGAMESTLINSFDIIALTESRLTPTFKDVQKINFPNYHPISDYRRDRVTDTGGGIIVFISEALGATRRYDLEHPDIEAMFIEIRSKFAKFLLCVCYRQPDGPVDFWDDLQALIDVAKQDRITKMIITGDLNADPTSAHGPHLQQFATQNHFIIHIDEPTRITDNTATILDQFVSNMAEQLIETNILPPISTSSTSSDHCTIAAHFNFHVSTNKCFDRHIWDYKNADFIKFRNELSDNNWDHCFESDDINQVVSRWSEDFMNIAKRCIPNRRVKIRPHDKPYYNSYLRRLKRKQDRLHNKAKKLNTPVHWSSFREARNKYNRELENAENEYNLSLSAKLENKDLSSPKTWWKIVKDFLGYKSNVSLPPIKNGDLEYFDNTDKANAFNEFFLSHSNIDASSAQLPNQYYHTNNRLSNLMLTEDEVCDILKCIDTSKATGPDSISPKMLKEAGRCIVPSLTRLFNMSLNTSSFPQQWKNANVNPLHKKNDKSVINNYRPISLLSCLGKIFERLVFKHVFNFFRENLLISIHQSGFTPGDSTVNQLVQIYHLLCEALDKKKDVRIVFFDISKAFDRVWHKGLLFKLKANGIEGPLLTWFENYLTNRKQRVVVGSCASEWGTIKAGVPQGSVLGPLLFLIYINDITSEVTSNIKLFADDTTIYVTVDDPAQASDQLNRDLDSISNWAHQWLVTFSPPKTESMLITFKTRNQPHPPLFLENAKIVEVNCHKHLGVTLTNDLTWKDHIPNIVKTAGENVDLMSRLMYKLDRKTLQTMYFSFVRPKLEYANIVWSNLNQTQSLQVELIQKRAGRIVSGAIKGTKTEVIYEELGWDSLCSRREQQCILFMHKVVNGLVPKYLQDLLPDTVGEETTYNLRNCGNFRNIPARTTTFYKTLIPNAVRSWNLLDPDLKMIHDHVHFKNEFTKNCPKPNSLFYYGERKVAVVHARLRMKCSILNAHLYENHVIPEPSCSCGHSYEDVLHYFFICPLYNNSRQKLHETISNYATFNIHTILYGRDNLPQQCNHVIFDAVFLYIKETQRFKL